MEVYIHNLIENIPKREKPLHVDIVMEGGAFNGGYLYGILLFIKELKKKNYLKISRISGCSIGAIVATLFFVNKLKKIELYYSELRKHLKKNLNVKISHKIISDVIKEITNDEFNIIKKDKLFISYYNVAQKKYVVQSTFKNKSDLKNALFRTTHFPLLIDGGCLLQNRYLDGFVPHIFSDREEDAHYHILYLTINRFSQVRGMFNTRHEKTIKGRTLEGIIEFYNFLLYKKQTKICSFVHQWTLMDYAKIRTKQMLLTILIYLLDYLVYSYKLIYPYLHKIEIYNRLKPVLHEMYRDFVLLLCF